MGHVFSSAHLIPERAPGRTIAAVGLVLALVTGYGEAGDAPIIVLILLAITLVVHPGGVFGRGKSRAV